MEKLQVTNDYIFKKIFAKEGNEDILKNLLISILEIPIERIKVERDKHLEKVAIENKEGILDIKATLNNNVTVNIEMQVRNQYNMIDRSLYYWSKLYSSSLKTNNNYAENNKTIAINILMFNIFKEGPYHEKCMIRRDYNGNILTEDFEMHFIQIPKFKENKVKTKLDVWVKFIGNKEMGEDDMYELDEETKKALREAQKQYDDLNADPEVRRVAELRMKAIMDNATNMKGAYKDGIKEGEEKSKIEIAKKLKKINISIDNIEKVTGLSKEEIEKL